MSETWGPRAHPERCSEEHEAYQRLESRWSQFVWLVLITFAMGMLGYIWWTGG